MEALLHLLVVSSLRLLDLLDVGTHLFIGFPQGGVLVLCVGDLSRVLQKLVEVAHRLGLGRLELAHGVLDGRGLRQVVSVHLEEHLLDVRHVDRVDRGLTLVVHVELELEQAVQLLPELESLPSRQLLQNETHAVCKGAQGDVLLVLHGQRVQDLLFHDRKGVFDVVHSVAYNLGELWNQLSLGEVLGLRGVWVLDAVLQISRERRHFLRLLREHVNELVVALGSVKHRFVSD